MTNPLSTLIAQGIALARKANDTPLPPVGSRIQVNSGEHQGTIGTIISHRNNVLGIPVAIITRDDSNIGFCYYGYELTVIPLKKS